MELESLHFSLSVRERPCFITRPSGPRIPAVNEQKSSSNALCGIYDM